MKSKCEEIEKMLDSTWITAYLDCVKKTNKKNNKI
jgi:hypothetical protein